MTLGLHALMIVDPILLRKFTIDNVSKISKRGMLIFRDQL